MRIHLWQCGPVHGDVGRSLERLEQALEKHLEPSAEPSLVLLPELALGGYLFDSTEEARRVALSTGELVGRLSPLAARHATALAVGFSERQGDSLFNSLAVVDAKGDLRALYRKIFLANIDHRFDPGTEPVVFDLGGVRFGIALCLDLWFPELMRTYLDRGVDSLLHASAFGGSHTLELGASRARENDFTVVTCNRVGREQFDGLDATYCGRSRAVIPNGRVIAAAEDDSEQWLRCEVRKRAAPRRILGVDIAEQRRLWTRRSSRTSTER